MLTLAYKELRRRPGTLLGAMVMTTIGACLITTFMVMFHSIEATRAPVQRYAAAPVVTAGSPGLYTPAMVANIAAVPGVERVIPELSFPVQVLNDTDSPVIPQQQVAQFGHAWSSASLTPMVLVQGTAPTGPDTIVMDQDLATKAGLAAGARARIDVGGVVHDVTVAGIARSPRGAMHQHALYFTDTQATALAGRGGGRVDAVGVLTSPQTDAAVVSSAIQERLTASLAGDVVTPSGNPAFRVAIGADRGELEAVMPDHRASAQAMSMLVWIVAAMAVVVIAGALVSSVRRRAAQIALLRAVGATPGQVRLLCAGEALLVAAVGTVSGIPAGTLLAWALIAVVRTTGTLSPALQPQVDVASVLTAFVVVVLVSQVAAWLTSRTALRTRPGDLTGGTAPSPRARRLAWLRPTLGAAAILAAGIVQILGMTGALPTTVMGTYGLIASLLIITGVALLGSLLVHLAAGLFRRPISDLSPVSGHLAAANIAHHHRRYAGVTVPLTVGLALAGWALVGLPLYALANAEQFAARIAPDSTVVTTPLVRDAHTGLSEQARRTLATQPGVTGTTGFWEGWISALPADTQPSTSSLAWAMVCTGDISDHMSLGRIEGDLRAVSAADGIALERTYAGRNGATLGSQVQVRLPGATAVTTLPVRALYDGNRNGEPGVIVAQKALQDATGTRWNDYVLTTGRAQPAQLTAALSPHTTTATDHEGLIESYISSRNNLAGSPGTLGVVLVGVFLVLASVNALVLAHSDRLREFTALRRLNATPGDTRSMAAWEMLLAVVPASLLGLATVAWMAFSMAGGNLPATAWAYPLKPLLTISTAALIIAILASLSVVTGLQRRITRTRRGH